MMRKYINANPNLWVHLSWAGILLISLRAFLSVNDLAERDSTLSTALFGIGIAAMIAGGAFRLYQHKQAGQNSLRNFITGLAIGVAIAAVMMATGIIHTPSFVSELFH